MHDRAERLAGAMKSAVATTAEIMILLNIKLRITQVRPRVEESVQCLPALTPVSDRACDNEHQNEIS